MAGAADPPERELDDLKHLVTSGQQASFDARAAALLERYPRSSALLVLVGLVDAAAGRFGPAAGLFDRAAGAALHDPVPCYLLGVALGRGGESEAAVAAFSDAIARDPVYTEALCALGETLMQLRRSAEALDVLDRAARLDPRNPVLLHNLGTVLQDLGRYAEATDCFKRSLALRPDHPATLANLGAALNEAGAFEAAAAALERSLAGDATSAATWSNLGATRQQQGQPGLAIAAFDRALALAPDDELTLSRMVEARAHICDWSDRSEAGDARAVGLGLNDVAVSPFGLLGLDGDPARQRQRAHVYATRALPSAAAACPQPVPSPDGRLRIGYVSADLQNHATMFLMSGLFREHDRSRFAIHALSHGPDSDDDMRRHVRAHVDSFTDVRGWSDAAIVAHARSLGLDIAVDLKGYTRDTRIGAFAGRLAPVQVSYIGYPGTLCAPFIDYIVADRQVVPDHQRAHYGEAVLCLPGSYQANDNRRPVSASLSTRADFGLPAHGFVFCCFNNAWKIEPRTFAIWMDLLRACDGSVLWLYRANAEAVANLRREAAARGVDPDRLVFADHVPHADHLARHRHADLFLDTFNFNAHTTASDALWAGLPLVTLAGRAFASRVAASLLCALGFDDLVTTTEADYAELARSLAQDPARLAAVRDRLALARQTAPLFDTVAHARALEAGYAAIHTRHASGLSPADIAIGPDFRVS